MATETDNLKLVKPDPADRGWGVTLNGNFDALDGFAPLSALAVTPRESPSSSLFVSIAPGSYAKADGTIGAFAGGDEGVTNDATTRIWLTDAGAIGKGASWPVVPHIRLAKVVASGGNVASVEDERVVHRTIKSAPSLPSDTASGSYGATEQAMLQAVYDAVRNLGIGD